MPEANPIEQLRQRLLELGCPNKVVRRIVREASEHLDDLQKSGIALGQSPNEACILAREQFGNPAELAERHMEAMRNSSWWGRNPFWGFGVMPVGLVSMLGMLYWYFNLNGFPLAPQFNPFPVQYPWVWAWMFPVFCGVVMIFTGLVAGYFCRACLHAGLGRRWMWAVGGLLAMHGLFLHIDTQQGINLTSKSEVIRDEKTTPSRHISIYFHPEMTSGVLPNAFSYYRWPSKNGISDAIVVMKAGENPRDKWIPLDDATLEGQLAAGLKDFGQRPLFSLEDLFWRPGWTASASPSGGNHKRSFEAHIFAQIDVGHLFWSRGESVHAPLPVVSYGWPRLLGESGLLSMINAALPLLVVAAMLVWQRREDGLPQALA